MHIITLFFLSYIISLFINYPVHYQFNHLEIFVDAFLLYIWGWVGYMIIAAGLAIKEEKEIEKSDYELVVRKKIK